MWRYWSDLIKYSFGAVLLGMSLGLTGQKGFEFILGTSLIGVALLRWPSEYKKKFEGVK